jgi:outer membrane protein TolC
VSVTANSRSAQTLTICVLVFIAHSAAAQRDTAVEFSIRARADSAYPQLTLRETIARALGVSPTVAFGVSGLLEARAAERTARGTRLPTLSLSSTANITEAQSGGGGGTSSGSSSVDTTRAGSGSGKNTSLYATIGVGAAIDVYTGGRRRALTDAARAVVRGAASTLDSSRFAARFSAESTFYDVVRARDLVDVAEAGLADAQVLVRFTRDMVRAGTVTKSDLLRAELQAVAMQTQLLAANDTLVTAAYALGQLTGANGPVSARSDSASDAIRRLALDDSAIVQYAVKSSPMITGAIESLAASEARLRSARALYRPTITAGATYNKATITTLPATSTGGGTTTATGVTPATPGRPGWTVSLGTNYQLFTAHQREDSVARAEAAVYLARSIANDAARGARAKAAGLLASLRTASTTIALETDAIRSAREDLRVQIARYRAGISTMLDVLNSELTLVQAGYGLAQARNQYHTTRAALEALLGRAL